MPLVMVLLILALNAAAGRELQEIKLTCVDANAHGYATFQSHNQKVVANRQGIFMTHLRSRNKAYNAQQWRLLRSQDGGKTFAVIHEATDPTNPPVIESDADDNIYLIRPDFADRNAYLYRFRKTDNYGTPAISKIPGAAAGKYAMEIDSDRKQIYFLAHNGSFNVIGFDGTVKHGGKMLVQGPDAHPQYPHLQLDELGHLHAAWTNTKLGGKLYWDIRHLYSTNGGTSWQSVTGQRVMTPIVCDRHGPSLQVTLKDEFEVSTWLASMNANLNKLHFFYLARTEPPRHHHVRIDRRTAKREVDRLSMKGKTLALHGADGFFVRNPGNKDLYLIGRGRQGHLVCLISRDNGDTWHDYAQSHGTFNAYSIGGCRKVTADGHIIGSFTDQKGSNAINDQKSQVYFLRIKAAR